MKTEFLKSLGLDDDAISKVMAENGKDVNAEKSRTAEAKEQLTAAQNSIAELNEKLKNFDGTPETIKELQDKVKSYEQAEADRVAAEKKAAEERELNAKFDELAGKAKFVNDITRNGVRAEFAAAIADEKNKGKGYKEIYDGLIKDRADIFANANPALDIPGMGNGGMPDTDRMSDKEFFDNYFSKKKGD